MKPLTIGLTILAVTLVAHTASAQCTKDTDCKGDRICQNGVCVDPGSAATPAAPSIAPPVPEPIPAISADPCTRIICSGHGTCVLKNGEPTCACHSGFSADHTGLNCVAVTQPTTDPIATTTSHRPVTLARQGEPPSTGWAMAASIIGFVSGAGVIAMGIISSSESADSQELYDSEPCWSSGECSMAEENEAQSWIFGISALALGAAASPIVFVGGKSARRHGDVDGSVPFRIVGWASYGACLSGAVTLVGLGIAEVRAPSALIGIIGGIGGLSLFSFAIDALISRNQAKAAAAEYTSGEARILPLLTPTIGRDGSLGAVLGIGGRF